MEINRLNDTIIQYKQDNEILNKEKEEFEIMVGEKNDVISGHMKTLESMRSTILTLRDNLKSAFDDVENKKNEINKYKEKIVEIESLHIQNINDQRISLLSTINSHFIASGIMDSKESEFSDSLPTFELLFEIIVNKIRSSKDSKDSKESDENSKEAIKILENKNKKLSNQLRDFMETLEKKEKRFYSNIKTERYITCTTTISSWNDEHERIGNMSLKTFWFRNAPISPISTTNTSRWE